MSLACESSLPDVRARRCHSCRRPAATASATTSRTFCERDLWTVGCAAAIQRIRSAHLAGNGRRYAEAGARLRAWVPHGLPPDRDSRGRSDVGSVRRCQRHRDVTPSGGRLTADQRHALAEPTPDGLRGYREAGHRAIRRVPAGRAETGATSDAADPRLAEYTTGAVLENLRAKLAVRQQSGTRLYGAPVPHVQSVSLSGNLATVKDCLDNSGTGLMDGSGNKLSVGRDRQETTATLVLEEGVWKVSEITTIAGGGSC
jgi:hypothetical protein